jgi:predicted peptidase
MKIFRLGFAAILAMTLWAPWTTAAPVSDFLDFSLQSSRGTVVLPGRLYVPPEAAINPAEPRPFILFLHGGGEAGTNNTAQVNGNIDNLLAEAKRRGAFLCAPQSPGAWSSVDTTNLVMSMVDRALFEQNVDANRLYVTGLSNGGGGTWNVLSRYSDRFAAAVPICSVNPASDFVPANLIDVPIAAFHARNDSVVSVTASRTTFNRILTAAQESLPTYPSSPSAPDFVHMAPNHDLNYIEFAFGGHGIWGPVYAEPQLYDWLFSHSLAVPEPGALAMASIACCGLLSAARRRRTA